MSHVATTVNFTDEGIISEKLLFGVVFHSERCVFPLRHRAYEY